MSNLFNRVESLWDNLKEGRAKTRAHFVIDRAHVANGDQLGPRFKQEQHYFQVILNQMFLAHTRLWYKEYDPVAFVNTSYIYDKNQLDSLPVIVGPTMLKGVQQEEVPAGMIFRNTPVTGLHPYQGGPLALMIILNRLERKNNAEKLLQVVESIAGAASPSTSLSLYLTLARTVVSGFETLLGLQQTMPVMGYRITINPDVGQVLEPAYYALIDADAQQVDRNKFWVCDSQLCYGDDITSAQPYHDHDFILFLLAQAPARSDERTLPFYPLWESTSDLAQKTPVNHYWEDAKAQFNALKRLVRGSPDLTRPDKDRLIEDYLGQMDRFHQEAKREGQLAPAQISEEEQEFQRIADKLARL